MATATAQGWNYRKHDQFSVVLEDARRLTGNDRLRGLWAIANDLNGNYYKREFLLNPESIGLDLNSICGTAGHL